MRLKFVICDDIPGVARTIKDMIVNELSLRENDVKCFSFTDNLLDYFKNNSCDNIIIDLAMDSTGLPKKDRDASKSSTKLTVEELKTAQNYIAEAGEFFSVSANNSILSIIYAFVTTVLLSIGSFFVRKNHFKKCRK